MQTIEQLREKVVAKAKHIKRELKPIADELVNRTMLWEHLRFHCFSFAIGMFLSFILFHNKYSDILPEPNFNGWDIAYIVFITVPYSICFLYELYVGKKKKKAIANYSKAVEELEDLIDEISKLEKET